MENASKPPASPGETAQSHGSAAVHPNDWRSARAGYFELLSMGMPRVNWLLIGHDGAIRSLLEMLPLDGLVLSWRPGALLVLPATPRSGTVLLHDIDQLTPTDQLQLLEWLERPMRRARVVSTTSTRLLPRVHAGTFVEPLYYGLNTICVDVTPNSGAHPRIV